MQESILQKQTEYIDYPLTNRLFLLLFCGYVVYWYLQGSVRFTALGAIRFEFIYAGFLSVVALATRTKKREICPVVPYIGLYFLILIIQIPFSYDIDTSWDVFIDRIVKFSFMAFFITSFVQSPRDLRYFLGAFVLACLKMGQEGFIGNITGSMMWQNQGVTRLHGATPNYFHPNSFAGMALGTFPFVYALWPISSKVIKVFLFLLAFLGMNIIIFSGSRTGYASLIILVFFIIFKTRHKGKPIIATIVFAVLIVSFAPQEYHERFQSIFTGQDREGHSINARIRILQDSWEIFLNYPLGVGISAFPAVRQNIFGRSQDTHNLYLEIATNLGIQGLVVFALLLIKTFRILYGLQKSLMSQREKIIACIKRKKNPDHSVQEIEQHLQDIRLLESVSLAVSLFVVVRLALGLFGMDLYEIYWWFAFGLVIALWHMEIVSGKKTEKIMSQMDSNV